MFNSTVKQDVPAKGEERTKCLTQLDEWQHEGGILEIPDGWFVNQANFDVDDPYIMICYSKDYDVVIKLSVPKSLAYYLSTHFCGSEKMKDMIEGYAKYEVQTAIKQALGIEE
jgi:hypothetical protein